MAVHEESSRYFGEDNEVTTEKELLGWYSYGLAAEVFAVCGVGSFLPITLEQLARERGVLMSDRVTPCVQHTPVPQFQLRHLSRRDDNQCAVQIFGNEINTSSFALYSFSLAIFVQSLVLVSIGAVADYGGNRKRLLLVFGFMGAIASMLFILVSPTIYLLGVLLTIISVACLGSSFVLLNSFLPLLAANHPTTRDKENESSIPLNTMIPDVDDDQLDGNILVNEDLQNNLPQFTKIDTSSPRLQLSNQISSKGVGIGYAAAVFVQIISIIIIFIFSKLSPSTSTSTLPMRTVLFVVGIWWTCFTFPTLLWLRSRPGPPLPFQLTSKNHIYTGLRYITFGWISLWRTIIVAFQLRQVIIFLIGWFLLSDGIATISGTAILFARTELNLGTAAIALLSITGTASGIVGAFCWPIIGRRYELKPISIVIACVFIFEFIPLYGLAGFLPVVKAFGFGGFQQWWELYPLAFILGFVMGGISSYCRSVFGALIPPGMEAAFYALYAVTDKGSSVIGPAIVGRIIDATGSIRMAFWFLSVLMIAPAPIFWCLNVEKGREEGVKMTEQRRRTRME